MKHKPHNETNRYRNGSGFLYGRCDFALNCPNTNSTNVSLPDDFDKILSVMRSRGVSVSIILQNLAQLKALFEKQWESIVGNCDEFVYLGGNEQSTHKYVSELLGKETIDTNSYGRFFKLYIYAAIAPVPLSAFAGEETSHIGKAFIKSFAAVCLEGAVIVLGCIIYSLFAASPPSVAAGASAITQVWTYVGELLFNMLVLVGTIKLSDRVVKDMMGL